MNIRFKELVKKAGQPEAKSLWTDPKQDRGFQKAVKENRVLTIAQQPSGKKKEFGEIGFHEQRHATYLIFPKPLPKEADARIIGIDYTLIGQPKVRDAIDSSQIRHVKSAKAMAGKAAAASPAAPKLKAEAPKPKPRKTIAVVVRRTAILETIVTVEANNKTAAKRKAVSVAKNQPFEIAKAVFRTEALSAKD